jgi:hypothetical protein
MRRKNGVNQVNFRVIVHALPPRYLLRVCRLRLLNFIHTGCSGPTEES